MHYFIMSTSNLERKLQLCFIAALFGRVLGTAGPYAVCLNPVGPKMALNSAELLPG